MKGQGVNALKFHLQDNHRSITDKEEFLGDWGSISPSTDKHIGQKMCNAIKSPSCSVRNLSSGFTNEQKGLIKAVMLQVQSSLISQALAGCGYFTGESL